MTNSQNDHVHEYCYGKSVEPIYYYVYSAWVLLINFNRTSHAQHINYSYQLSHNNYTHNNYTHIQPVQWCMQFTILGNNYY